jgi:GNAT superfamily N-acetyltransferase
VIEIRLLLPGDDRSRFTCGVKALDRYFHHYAGQNQFRHRIGANYVALADGEIVGFATVSPAQIEGMALPAALERRLPHYPLPVLRLARLATSQAHHRQGTGLLLLRYVLRLAQRMSREFGCIGVVVDAKPDAVSFYERYGFRALDVEEGALREAPRAMFLAMGSIPAETER